MDYRDALTDFDPFDGPWDNHLLCVAGIGGDCSGAVKHLAARHLYYRPSSCWIVTSDRHWQDLVESHRGRYSTIDATGASARINPLEHAFHSEQNLAQAATTIATLALIVNGAKPLVTNDIVSTRQLMHTALEHSPYARAGRTQPTITEDLLPALDSRHCVERIGEDRSRYLKQLIGPLSRQLEATYADLFDGPTTAALDPYVTAIEVASTARDEIATAIEYTAVAAVLRRLQGQSRRFVDTTIVLDTPAPGAQITLNALLSSLGASLYETRKWGVGLWVTQVGPPADARPGRTPTPNAFSHQLLLPADTATIERWRERLGLDDEEVQAWRACRDHQVLLRSPDGRDPATIRYEALALHDPTTRP